MRQNNNIINVPYYAELLALLADAYFVLVKLDSELAEQIKDVLEVCDSTLLFRS